MCIRDRSSSSYDYIKVSANQRPSSSNAVRLKVSVVNNTVDYGYIDVDADSEVSSSNAQNAAIINVSGNTIARNGNAYVSVDYRNYGLPMDSTTLTVSNNNVQGRNSNGQGIVVTSNGNVGSNWIINNNTVRSTNNGIYLTSERNSKFHIENNTIDSTYNRGIYKQQGSANIIGNTIEYCGKYYWNSNYNGVYLNSSSNYPATDTLKNNTIRYNGSWEYPNQSNSSITLGVGGVTIDGNTVAVLNANNIYENKGHDVTNLVSKSIASIQDARYNYWGDSTTLEMNTGANPKNIISIHDEYDDALKGFVNYAGYVDTLDGTPSALNVLGDLKLLSASGGQAFNYPQGDTLRVRVSDADRNVSTLSLIHI
mgnify:FL=1